MRACEVDPRETGRCVRVYAGAPASPKSRPSSTAGRLARPSTACQRGRRAGPGGAAGSSHGPPPRPCALAARRPGLAAGRAPADCAAGRGRPAGRWPLDPPVAGGRGGSSPRRGRLRPATAASTSPAGSATRCARRRPAWWPSRAGVAGRGVVSVDHPGGLRTTYEPVAATVARGDPVGAGAVLGRLELVREPLPAGGLPALGAAARRDLSRPTVDARCGPGPVAAGLGLRRRRYGAGGAGAGPRRPSGGRRARRPALGTPDDDSGSGAARLTVGAAAAAVGTERRCSAGGERRPQSRPGRSAASRR